MKSFLPIIIAFLLLFSLPSYSQWAKKLSGGDGALPTSLTTDSNGNSYVTGDFTGAMTINNATVLANSSPGIIVETLFVAKFDPQGGLVWIQRATGSNRSFGEAVTMDGAGNIVVVGRFQGTLTVGSFTLTSSSGVAEEGFAVRYNAQGVPLAAWVVRGQSGSFACTDVVADASGNSYVSGTRTTTSNGTTTFNSFLRKYSAQGQQVWAKEGTGSYVKGGRLAATGTTLISTGLLSGTATFSSQINLTSTPGQYAAAYDIQTGTAQWAYLLAASPAMAAPAIQADATGFYVANSYTGTIVLGSSIPLAGRAIYSDAFVAKFTLQGAAVWAKAITGAGTSYNTATCLALAPGRNHLVVGGSFQGTCTFSTSTQVTSAGDSDLFAAFYTTSGVFQTVRRDGGRAIEQASGVALDASGNQPLMVGLLRIPQSTGATSTTLAGTSFTVGATYNDGFVARLTAVPLAAKGSAIHSRLLIVYPNPSQDGRINVEFGKQVGPATLRVLNGLGQAVYTCSLPANSVSAKVSTAQLVAGRYIVQVATDSWIATQALLVE